MSRLLLATLLGVAVACTGIHGLNRLHVWWLQLGITHQRIAPGSPQENGLFTEVNAGV